MSTLIDATATTLSVTTLSVTTLSVTTLSVTTLSVTTLSVTTLSVTTRPLAAPLGSASFTDIYNDTATTSTTLADGILTTTTNLASSAIDIVRTNAGGRLISENTATVPEPTTYDHDDLGRVTYTHDLHGLPDTVTCNKFPALLSDFCCSPRRSR